MKIGFGATLLAKNTKKKSDGIATYSRSLLEALCNLNAHVIPYSFNSKDIDDLSCQQSLGNIFEFSLAQSLLFKKSFPKPCQSIDLFHATDHRIPRYKHIPVIATIMDPIPLAHPEWVNQQTRGLKNWAFKSSAQWADHIITISEFSAQEISKHFEISRDKISITPLGVDARYFDLPERKAQQHFLHERGLDKPFFLHLGTLQPRKNTERLLDAFEALPNKIQQAHPLVIAGQVGWQVNALMSRINNLTAQGKIHYLGYVSESEKSMLLHAAHALVFPSLYEGFGLPILEAFAAKLPVITSNTTAIPEVANKAAILVNPIDVRALQQAMIHITESSQLRQELQQKGQLVAKAHSWEACAKKTIAIYEHVLNQKFL